MTFPFPTDRPRGRELNGRPYRLPIARRARGRVQTDCRMGSTHR